MSTRSGHRNLRSRVFSDHHKPQPHSHHVFSCDTRTRRSHDLLFTHYYRLTLVVLGPHLPGLTRSLTLKHSKVRMTSKSPFLLSFIAGILSVVVIGALAFALIFAWRYYRGRQEPELSSKEIPLTTLENGPSTSDKLDSSSRSPSRLGGHSPSSAERADEAWEPLRQFLTQTGTTNSAQNDAQRPLSVVSPSSAFIVYPMITEGVEQVQDHHMLRAKNLSDPTTLGKDGDMSTKHDQPQPFISPSPQRNPPLPSAPPKSNGRLSISTVWSQESMWPREKMPDVPVPPLAHLPVTRRVVFSPLMVAGSQNRRSITSLPHSVGQSDFEDDF